MGVFLRPLCSLSLALLFSPSARAQAKTPAPEPATEAKLVSEDPPATLLFSLSLVAGYATAIGQFVDNPYGLGAGARAGVTFPSKYRVKPYAGVSFLYFGGTSTGAAGSTISARAIPLGAELGLDFSIGRLLLRPCVGVGPTFYSHTPFGAGGYDHDLSGVYGAVWAGALVAYGLTDHLYAGLDVRYTALPSLSSGFGGGGGDGPGIFGDVGVRF